MGLDILEPGQNDCEKRGHDIGHAWGFIFDCEIGEIRAVEQRQQNEEEIAEYAMVRGARY